MAGKEYGLIEHFRVDYLGTKETDPEKLRNLLIYFAPRSVAGKPPLHKLPNLHLPSPTRSRALTAISTLVNVHKHGGLHTQWKKIRISGALSSIIKVEFPTFMGRTANHWGGDMVWGCYTDYAIQSVDLSATPLTAQETIKNVMGVTSQNRIGIVTRCDQQKVAAGSQAFHETDARYYQLLAIWDDAH